ncbi:MAG: sugar-specific transcriptional regulator TrmB [Halonotius sp. J07HN6]|jgi:Sugar-specific transcriptional regulator TrmB.|nr:MAG: sugar-specific transcriptional regulator TrmB [Halonotius sp. J07HN6]
MSDAERPDWTDRSAADRVRSVATTLSEPRTANWIAEEAEVAHETASKYLDRLVDDGQVETSEAGGKTVYRPDPVGQYLAEMHRLYADHTADELADSLTEIGEQLRAWQTEYAVETPNELRSAISETSDAATAEEYRRVATEWERLQYRQSLVEDTLRLYDRFADDASPAPV